ncbi:DUF1173 family protein [Nocardia uniformis]|uniref:DUF1173 family protein n=1 Tax=Nocardia uniformis TaxID=53432 RepID=A0A849CIM7_9NOCA|nr:DUF1173 family protein [Nocardia uniformis]NNH73831.1 DUF1173 family protein [Nocardia uniformis]
MYAIDDQVIDRARIGDDYLQPLLAAVHRNRSQRPRCLCSASETGGVDMYVARVGGRYVLKRMPGTGPHHAPGCSSYAPPAELTGLAPLIGTAIREQPNTGLTRLTLGFPLTHRPARAAATTSDPCAETEADEHIDEAKLTLRAVLHLLWDDAGFVRWVPAMAGRRNWAAIRRHTYLAAHAKTTKSRELSELLWLPEPFTVADKNEIAARRSAVFAPFTGTTTTRRLMLGLGEVKDLTPARFGRHKLIIKHAPDCPFIVEADTAAALRRTHATELALRQAIPDSKLIALLTFGVTAAGVAVADRIAVMNVSADWIPFESVFEHTLLASLISHRRRFTKTLRYNQSAATPLASLILTDTDPPTACYLTSATTHGPPPQPNPDLPLAQWIWNTSVDAMPPIPPPISRPVNHTRPHRTPLTHPTAEEAHHSTDTKEAPPWPKPDTMPTTGTTTKTPCAPTSATTTE